MNRLLLLALSVIWVSGCTSVGQLGSFRRLAYRPVIGAEVVGSRQTGRHCVGFGVLLHNGLSMATAARRALAGAPGATGLTDVRVSLKPGFKPCLVVSGIPVKGARFPVGSAAANFNDTVILKNGTRITGVKTAVTRGSVIVSYPTGKIVVLKKYKVRTIRRGR